jgi:Flp pilus assembly protein TadG
MFAPNETPICQGAHSHVPTPKMLKVSQKTSARHRGYLCIFSTTKNIATHCERGQVIVEYALIAVVLFILLMGAFDFGRAVWMFSSASEAAREGARYAMVRGNTCVIVGGCLEGAPVLPVDPPIACANASSTDYVVRKACSYLAGIDWQNATVQVTLPARGYDALGIFDEGHSVGQPVRVTVRITYRPVTALLARLVGNMVTLQSTAEQIITY